MTIRRSGSRFTSRPRLAMCCTSSAAAATQSAVRSTDCDCAALGFLCGARVTSSSRITHSDQPGCISGIENRQRRRRGLPWISSRLAASTLRPRRRSTDVHDAKRTAEDRRAPRRRRRRRHASRRRPPRRHAKQRRRRRRCTGEEKATTRCAPAPATTRCRRRSPTTLALPPSPPLRSPRPSSPRSSSYAAPTEIQARAWPPRALAAT